MKNKMVVTCLRHGIAVLGVLLVAFLGMTGRRAAEAATQIVDSKASAAAAMLARLDPTGIPLLGRASWQPKELVAVLGEQGGRHWGPARRLAYSPDGKWIASVGLENCRRVWDASTMQEIAALAGEKDGLGVASLAFSRDGSLLAVGSRDGTIRVWDCPGWRLRETLTMPEGLEAAALAFSPDGQLLVAGNLGSLAIWTIDSLTPRGARFASKASQSVLDARLTVESLAFRTNGKTLVGAIGKRAVLWDVRDGAVKRAAIIEPQRGDVKCVAFSPDGKFLACACSGDGEEGEGISLWDVDGDHPVEIATLHADDKETRLSTAGDCVAISRDGKILAAGGYGNVVFWRLDGIRAGARTPLGIVPIDLGTVAGIAFSPDGKRLAAAYGDSEEGGVAIVELSNGPPWQARIRKESARVYSVGFSPDGKTMATGSKEGVRLWNIGAPAPSMGSTVCKVEAIVDSMVFSPDGKTLLCCSRDTETGTIATVWDVGGNEAVLRGRLEPVFTARAIAFSPERAGIAMARATLGAKSTTIDVWDFWAGNPGRRHTIGQVSGEVTRMAFLARGDRLAAGTNDGTLRIWDLRGETPKQVWVHKETRAGSPAGVKVEALCTSRDGTTLLTGGRGQGLMLWRVPADQSPIAIIRAFPYGDVRCAAISPDGSLVTAADGGGLITVWNVQTGKEVTHWRSPGVVNAIVFGPDSRHLATVNANGSVYILRVPM